MKRIQYNSKDFSRLTFQIFELDPRVQLTKEFPRLGTVQVFAKSTGRIESNLLLRYVIFCYDRYSPLREIEDLPLRKETALHLAGITEPSPGVEALLDNKLPIVCDMIIEYCRLQNSRVFQMKVVALEALYEYQRLIIDPIDRDLDDDKKMRAANLKTKLIEDCDVIHSKIKKYNEELYGSDDDAVEVEQFVRISPETISRVFKGDV